MCKQFDLNFFFRQNAEDGGEGLYRHSKLVVIK